MGISCNSGGTTEPGDEYGLTYHLTSVGTETRPTVPSAGCPLEMIPQQATPPSTIAQLSAFSAARNVAPPSPVTGCGVGAPDVEPFPTCPKSLLPQHFAEPLANLAQLKPVPAAMPAAPLKPVTATG